MEEAIQTTDLPTRVTPTAEEAVDPLGEASERVHLVLVFEDELTRQRALLLCERTMRVLGPETVQFRQWSVARLLEASSFPAALAAALRADVLMVALYAGEDVPGDLAAWTDLWLPRRAFRPGALVALLGVPHLPLEKPTPAHEYLGAVARRAHLDFLPHEFEWAESPLAAWERIAARAHHLTPTLAEILGHKPRPAFDHWGLNE